MKYFKYSRPGKIDTGKIDTFYEIPRNFEKFRVRCSKDFKWPFLSKGHRLRTTYPEFFKISRNFVKYVPMTHSLYSLCWKNMGATRWCIFQVIAHYLLEHVYSTFENSKLPYVDFGENDHRGDVPHFIWFVMKDDNHFS